MKKWPISLKLFAVTCLFLTLFLSAVQFVQLSWFEPYYKNKKMSEIKTALDTFKAQHYKSPGDFETLSQSFSPLEINYDAVVATADLKNPDNIVYDFGTNTPHIRLFLKIRNPDEAGMLSPERVQEMMLPDILNEELKSFLDDRKLYDEVTVQGRTVAYESDKMSPISRVVAISPLPAGGSAPRLLVAMLSLQPVGEAGTVLKDFYVYTLFVVILGILLLAWIYSRMISRPLVRLNHAALRMAELDFSVACDVRTEDEIGQLGRSLNSLSGNLQRTLGQLHEANEQLKRDIEKEKRLEQLRKEFVAGVSHELKTPISLIGGYAEGLRDNIAQGKARDEYLDVIVEETEKMSAIINDLLDLSQLEAMKYKLRLSDFPLNELVCSAARKYAVEAEKKAARLDVSVRLPDGGHAFVRADRLRIEQVLTNLLGNAVKHTPDGGRIEVVLRPEADGKWLVSVENEGEPIPEDDLPHIWDTFYKVEKSRTSEIGGTGIGLAIVRNILNLHESRFGAENLPGGVRFFFTLDAHAP
ncbi:sensor histidine kinase [Paenibacillus hamazuiensis]|uniref:sensor histidine kinase n=1 Tax=Paenibacillus hamazuiensis TaxID=2936508 RepID=UPI00200EF098|nr:HAMP domain-containing sensor histidine kinase [Paenibacillus hamazuiensis]